MRLIVIRHGESSFNIDDRFTGQSDVPLSELGVRQAHLLGQYLATEALDAIIASDLQRAYLTAEAIVQHHPQLSVVRDPALRELSLGQWEGLTKAEVSAREPEHLRHWQADPAVYAPPGGETLEHMRTRIQQALANYCLRYPQGTVVWAAHAGLIGVLICHVLDIDLKRRGQFHHDNASVAELWIEEQHVHLVKLNETAFLRHALREKPRSEDIAL